MEGQSVAMLRVRGPLGAQPREAMSALMRRAAERLGMAWTEVPADGPLGPCQWHHRLDHRGEVSGCVGLCLGSEAELQLVAAVLTDAVVNFAGTPTLLEVEVAGSGEGNRRVGRRGPARG